MAKRKRKSKAASKKKPAKKSATRRSKSAPKRKQSSKTHRKSKRAKKKQSLLQVIDKTKTVDRAITVYDEIGDLGHLLRQSVTSSQDAAADDPSAFLTLDELNGSWLLHIIPSGMTGHLLRGALRLEMTQSRFRVSGDVYVRFGSEGEDPLSLVQSITDAPLVIGDNWYPAFAQNEYRWYLRSTGVSYENGSLFIRFERHLWSPSEGEFVTTDAGSISFSCPRESIDETGLPRPALAITGQAVIGGETHTAIATKTADFYRGCAVEVDVMRNRTWPETARRCDGSESFGFTQAYRDAGLDFEATVSDVSIEDTQLSIPELHNLLATHRSSPSDDNWRLWLLIGSRQNGTLGIMFDTGQPPHREGAVGYFDPALPNISIIDPAARGKKLGEVPYAFLRTLVHEAGHAFNLFHPKHDVHTVPIGTTVMNQTGDVIGFATNQNRYPCNAELGFHEHNQRSLIHSSDPQVKPGWKAFGWGHGGLSGSAPEPVDLLGIGNAYPVDSALSLDVTLPENITLGEYIAAEVRVHNSGRSKRKVSSALNLAEGDLRIRITDPAGNTIDARDVVVACSARRMVELKQGDSFLGTVQLFYGAQGLTFVTPGRYHIQAEFDLGDAKGTTIYSDKVALNIREAVSNEEQELADLSMDPGVGLSLALGDFGTDKAVAKKIEKIVSIFAKTDIGRSCALVAANSLSRTLRDPITNKVCRRANRSKALKALEIATDGIGAEKAAKLVTSVISPRDTTAPLLDRLTTHIAAAKKGTFKTAELRRMTRVLQDFLS